jgi:hypothetical protein
MTCLPRETGELRRATVREMKEPFRFGSQVLISSHRKLLWLKSHGVSVAETAGQDSGRRG